MKTQTDTRNTVMIETRKALMEASDKIEDAIMALDVLMWEAPKVAISKQSTRARKVEKPRTPMKDKKTGVVYCGKGPHPKGYDKRRAVPA